MVDLDDHEKPLDLFLCIDGGGTKTKVTITGRPIDSNPFDFKPIVLSTGSSHSSNFLDQGLHQAIQSIGHATSLALRSIPTHYSISNQNDLSWNFIIDHHHHPTNSHPSKPQRAPFIKIWAGLSGINSLEDIILMKEELKKIFGLTDDQSNLLEVTNDSDLLSAQIEHHCRQIHSNHQTSRFQGGLVLIAGTGSILTAFKFNQITRSMESLGRLGGHGYLLGDEGSSFDLGKRTVKIILDHLDRDPNRSTSFFTQSDLLQQVLNYFDLQDPKDLLRAVYQPNNPSPSSTTTTTTEHDRKIKLAGLSKLIMSMAFPNQPNSTNQTDGDLYAKEIINSTAEIFSDLLIQICQIHSLLPSDLVLCLAGSMWSCKPFQDLVLLIHRQRSGGMNWGVIEYVQEPDLVGAIALASRP